MEWIILVLAGCAIGLIAALLVVSSRLPKNNRETVTYDLPDGVWVASAETIYGPGRFSGETHIETTRGRALILSTDWATVLENPKQMAWLQFEDGSEDLFLEDDAIFDTPGRD